MQRGTLFGVGAVLVSALCGCSGDDTAPGSKIAQPRGGSGGAGGESGSLSLGISGGGTGGGGAGGTGGAGGATHGGAGGAGGASGGGAPAGGTASHAGSSSGGSGGTKPVGMCKRAAASDADCKDFYPGGDGELTLPQAYACDDTGAYLTLNSAHASKCASVSFVTGAKYGACCPP